MMQSENILVQYMARRAMYNVLGTLGTNRVILRHKFGVPRNNCVLNSLYMFIYVAHLIRNTVYSYICCCYYTEHISHSLMIL